MNGNDTVFVNDTPPENYTESGYLIVNAFTARGAIPIKDATVTVSYYSPSLPSPHAVLKTDKSGRTPKISLPTPPRELSLSPSPSSSPSRSQSPSLPPSSTSPGDILQRPYALYNIEISKDGFYSVVDIGVKIFAGITAIQNTDLVPRSEELPKAFYTDDKIYIDETGDYDL